jgi:hypothetical protein
LAARRTSLPAIRATEGAAIGVEPLPEVDAGGGQSASCATTNPMVAATTPSGELTFCHASERCLGFFQSSVQHDGQNRLPDEVYRIIGTDRVPCRLVKVSAEENAAHPMARIYFACGFNPAAALGKPDVHESHVRIADGCHASPAHR